MLDVKKINLNYGSSQILFDVSIKAKKGNITCLMGSNGVGKTSLLKFLSGIQNAKNGTYFYNNNDYFYVMQRGKIIIEGDKEKLGKKLLKSQLSF